jgi:autotransporter-associated beta strand protein
VLNDARLALEGGLNVEGELLVLNSTATPALESLFGESYWSGQVVMQRHSTVGARESSILQLAGNISGAANLTKVGPGTLRFGGGQHNTYSGVTFVNQGVLLMSKPTGITAVPSTLIIGTPAGLPATAVNLTSYQVIGGIVVNRGGLLNLNGQVENVYNMVLNEGGDVETSTGVLFQFTGGGIFVFPGAVSDVSTIAGNLDMDTGTHVLEVAASDNGTTGPHLEITAMITSSLGAVTWQKNGAGNVRLSANNNYIGATVVNTGVLQVDGSQPSSSVVVDGGARLTGTGRVGPVTFASPSGIVAPGASPGILTVGNFNRNSAGGTLQLELNGLAAGTDYDRLSVRGLVDLTGMTLQASVNFAPAISDQFMIIGNDLFDDITGEFNGLPEGASVTFGDHVFQITYFGGTGNDVVLTKTADVYRPALTIERVAPASVRLRWPTNDQGFTLQFSTNLSAADWAAAGPLPAVTGTNNVVTNAAAGGRKFYRLFKP